MCIPDAAMAWLLYSFLLFSSFNAIFFLILLTFDSLFFYSSFDSKSSFLKSLISKT